MKFKKVSIPALLIALAVLLSSCGGPSVSETPDDVVSEPEQEIVSEPVYRSGLTGLPVENEEDEARRPVAVMINNIKKALPQYGISNASIIFEALAEGGITRLLAVFEDASDIEQIGTIRSARPYYLDFAQSVDAVYVHIGGSPEAYSEIKARNMDSYDLIEGQYNSMYWRDKERIKSSGYEHSVFTSGERIYERLQKDNVRMTRQSSYGKAFNFSEDAVYEGRDATKISAVFSSYKTGTYTYDESNGLYRIGQYGTSHTDALHGTQLAFKNVFILHMNSYVIKGDTAGRLRFDSVGSGRGTYFVNGTASDITWQRASKSAPFKFYTSDGGELPVVPGDSYVAIVPLDAEVTVTGDMPETETAVAE
ncbi:MAG: DUF3048 domain-containing protein [Oscillospiraceae bacterium]|nr:DUF3048 domain-containing protein [Oscillospiraceae bacterium]